MLAVTITTVFLLWWDLWLTVVDRLTQTYWSLAKLLITLNLAHSRIATTKLRDTGTPSSVQIQNLNLQRNVFIQEKLISINRYHKKYINTLIPFLTSFQCFWLYFKVYMYNVKLLLCTILPFHCQYAMPLQKVQWEARVVRGLFDIGKLICKWCWHSM